MVRISGVLANPAGSDKGQEYVTLINQSNEAVSLRGWSVATMSGKKIPLEGLIGAGEERTVMTGTVSLKNAGDTLTLISSTGQKIDVFSYSVSAEGQVMKPAALMSAEDNKLLFEEYALEPSVGASDISGSFSGEVILPGLCVAGILATLALYVLKQVVYDPLVTSPFDHGETPARKT